MEGGRRDAVGTFKGVVPMKTTEENDKPNENIKQKKKENN